jgi:hypothetical protein
LESGNLRGTDLILRRLILPCSDFTTLVSIFSYKLSLFSYNDGQPGGERQVNEKLTWKVKHEAAGRVSRQKAPAKAYFYWKRGGRLVRSAQFTQSELEVEIERLSTAGTDLTEFVLALRLLALSRGS